MDISLENIILVSAKKEVIKLATCGKKTEVYSRVCGYHRPITNWNKGKKEEFIHRKVFNVKNSVSNEHTHKTD